jgi:hypothetical protein
LQAVRQKKVRGNVASTPNQKHKKQVQILKGTNHAISSYNGSAVKIYNATTGLVRFENEIIFFYFEETELALKL